MTNYEIWLTVIKKAYLLKKITEDDYDALMMRMDNTEDGELDELQAILWELEQMMKVTLLKRIEKGAALIERTTDEVEKKGYVRIYEALHEQLLKV